MHCHYIEDTHGDLVDVIAFCSDGCHREYCRAHGLKYGGWTGCQEGSDYPAWCACCGVFAGGEPQCECQTDNVVVGRFTSHKGEKCEHGNWIQVPERYLESEG